MLFGDMWRNDAIIRTKTARIVKTWPLPKLNDVSLLDLELPEQAIQAFGQLAKLLTGCARLLGR